MTDVCLLLEGTYPYVRGGVSACVYQLIKGTPHITYGIVYIGAKSGDVKKPRYEIPDNVEFIKEIFLYEEDIETEAVDLGRDFDSSTFEDYHQHVSSGEAFKLEAFYRQFIDSNSAKINLFDILKSKQGWDSILNMHQKLFSLREAPPFIDFFYSWRYLNLPIFKILSTEIPRASIYHSLSTGYAGLLGAVAKVRYGAPFIISEHGIYSHEREIEISQADWLYNFESGLKIEKKLPFFKNWWINMFHFMSKTAYEYADTITTLYNGNREKQIKFGAQKSKCQIIPNGIKIGDAKRDSDRGDELVIGLVGRVVPIKDIKTFIKSISLVFERVENIKVIVMGPYEEDPDYYLECKDLISLLGLDSCIEFTGNVNLVDYYPKLDIMVLSSISEGQPIVLLEAFTYGIPCVTTDVGSCSELIFGMEQADRDLGPAGDVVPFGHPEELGNSIATILLNPVKMKEMGEVGKIRVKRYYTEEHYLSNHLNLYNKFSLVGGKASWRE